MDNHVVNATPLDTFLTHQALEEGKKKHEGTQPITVLFQANG